MKKLGVLLLVTAMLFTSLMAVPVIANGSNGNGIEISTVYVDQDFDDANYGFDIYDNVNLSGGSYVPVNVLNKATDKNMPWYTLIRDWKNNQWAGRVQIPTIGTNPDETDNKALLSGRKAQVPFYLNIDTDVDGVMTPSPIVEQENLIYMDLRIRRASLSDDPVTFSLLDSTDKQIYTIQYDGGKYPRLNASINYGGEASTAPPTINYPYTEDWVYIRTIINFQDTTFSMLYGDTLDDLKPIVDGVPSFIFRNTAAADIYSIKSATKGGLGFDDLKIYSVIPSEESKPFASNITIEGKPNIGATLTATYGTYADSANTEEGDSYGYWEVSDNSLFTGPVKITDNIPITQGGTSEYIITEAERGKYIRFTVIPVNLDGNEGDPSSSNVTEQPVDTTSYEIKTTGPIKWTNQFDLKFANNAYPAVVDVMNSTDEPISAILIAAWYENDIVTEIYSTPVNVDAGSSDEKGYITETFTTEAKIIPADTNLKNTELKIFIWDGYNTLTPLNRSLRFWSEY